MSRNDAKSNESSPKGKTIEGELILGSNGDDSNDGRTYEDGFKDGVAVGVQAGFEHAVEEFKRVLPQLVRQEIEKLPDIKRALSDGLRHGSSDCGRVLVDTYRHKKANSGKLY
jgi:hypothetical protein